MGYEACGLGSKWPTKLDGSSQFYPKCPNWFWIIIYESWSWFQVWLELSYKANRKITIRYPSLVGQCLSSGWHQEAVAAASGRTAGGPFDARDDMPRIITKSEPFHLALTILKILEGGRRNTLHPSPSHFCWLNHSFSHLLAKSTNSKAPEVHRAARYRCKSSRCHATKYGMGSSDTFGRLGGKDGGLNGRNLCWMLLICYWCILVFVDVVWSLLLRSADLIFPRHISVETTKP